MQVAEERKLPLPDSKKLSLETFILWVRCTAQGSGVRGNLLEYGKEIFEPLVTFFSLKRNKSKLY